MLDMRVGKIKSPSFQWGCEVAKTRHDHMLDRRIRDHGGKLVGKILHDDNELGTGILVLEFPWRIERVDVDHGESGPQRSEECDRVGQHVRQHDRDAVAWLALRRLAQKRRERAADAVPFSVADRRTETIEGGTLAIASAGIEQQCMQ
jgi:hypothetical protein